MVTSKHGINFLLAIGVTAAGCSSANSGNNQPDAGPPVVIVNPDAPIVSQPLDLNGNFAITSTFDLSTNTPGTVGTVVDAFIAATQGANAPAQWLVDQMIAAIPNAATQTILQGLEPIIVPIINQQITTYAPTWVTDIVRVGNDFGDAAKHFGTVSQFAVTSPTLKHTLLGAHFDIEGTPADYLFATYNVASTSVGGVGVTLDATNHISIAKHELPIPYGAMLRIALDAAIIPAIDPNAHDLGTFLGDEINCTKIGQLISDNAPTFLPIDPVTGAGFCTSGLNYAAQQLYAQIAKIDDAALTFQLTGTALGADKNADRRVDIISNGAWTGTLTYGTAPSLLNPATFSGTREP